MGESYIQSRRGLKRLRESAYALKSAERQSGVDHMTKLMIYFRRMYIALRMGYYDYVLLLLIISATWMQWSALRSMWG
jgi:hypothetical protein